MKRNGLRFFMGLSFSIFLFVCISCGTSGPIPKEWQEQYPLEDYVEIIESNKTQQELFNGVRSYLLDNYTGMNNYSWANSNNENNETISLHPKVNGIDPTNAAVWLEYDINIEFKDNRMRVGMRNVVICDYGYRWLEQRHTYGYQDLGLRKVGYAAYEKDKDKLISNLHKIAEGTLSTW